MKNNTLLKFDLIGALADILIKNSSNVVAISVDALGMQVLCFRSFILSVYFIFVLLVKVVL